ncbi:antitoxin family protein [Synechococcus sp. PCC 7336]|uniref:antitoxin family protein n=1 Tax=Synechococcus sp. PCC 7336 TaxID=195250 RepID=UPI000346E9BD|nr:antitoxin family protein [Synechococcus sp. PCC 7336]
MTIVVTAIYERGVLKPTEPIPLEEGERVEIAVTSQTSSIQPTAPADLLAAIANLPLENEAPFSGQDHDSILYPDSNHCP